MMLRSSIVREGIGSRENEKQSQQKKWLPFDTEHGILLLTLVSFLIWFNACLGNIQNKKMKSKVGRRRQD